MIEIYDNGGITFDRYTIIIDGNVYGMSANPYSPQGLNQYYGTLHELPMARSHGERITLESLPLDVQNAIEARKIFKLADDMIICPSCKAEMEHRSNGIDTAQNDDPNAKITHMWSCPDCPMICFEYINDGDIDALKTLIK